MSEDVERIAICERLREKVQTQPPFGGGSVSLDGKFTSYISDDGKRYANPDGMEAAALIEEMAAALRDVANPLDYLRRYAEAEGRKLSGEAYAIANNLHFVQKIAKDALAALQAKK